MGCETGTYALILRATERRLAQIGRLGSLKLTPGFYVYVGSALGPGGLAARIAHHRARSPRPRWHVDHLRRHTRLREVWYACSSQRLECHWAEALRGLRGASMPARGFGSSDCACGSHLFRFEGPPPLAAFRRRVRAARPGHAAIQTLRLGGDIEPEPLGGLSPRRPPTRAPRRSRRRRRPGVAPRRP